MNLDNLFNYGSLVEINYGSWSCSRPLSAWDLGYDTESIDCYLSKTILFDDPVIKNFRSLESHIDECLEEHTFPFFFYRSRFLPHSELMGFTSTMEKLIRKFHNRKEYLISNYDAMKVQSRPLHLKQAQKAYMRHKKLVKEPMERDAFINRFLEKISSLYLSPEELDRRVHFTYHLFSISYPRMNHIELPADQQHVYEKIKVLITDSRDYIDQKLNKLIENIVTSARESFYEKIMQIYNRMKAGGKYMPSTEKVLKKTIVRFHRMNFAGDIKMRDRLNSFEARFINRFMPADFRDNRYLRNNLLTDLSILASSAKKQEEINEAVVSFKKALGV